MHDSAEKMLHVVKKILTKYLVSSKIMVGPEEGSGADRPPESAGDWRLRHEEVSVLCCDARA